MIVFDSVDYYATPPRIQPKPAKSGFFYAHCLAKGVIVSETDQDLLAMAGGTVQSTEPCGYFEGSPQIELLPDGRNARLLRDFVYVHPDGRRFVAPAGMVTDGASIPALFQGIAGQPWVGLHRDAAIIHDVMWDGDKALANEIFRLGCIARGCPAHQVAALQIGVAVGAALDIHPMSPSELQQAEGS